MSVKCVCIKGGDGKQKNAAVRDEFAECVKISEKFS
jgi:hypothetical protein